MPRYIPKNSKMYTDLVAKQGPNAFVVRHGSFVCPVHAPRGESGLLTIPYLVLIGMAIFLQYYQMKQMNSRNPQAAAANPQMQQMQKFFPIIFGRHLPESARGSDHLHGGFIGHENRHAGDHVPHRDGDAGRGGGAGDRGRCSSPKGGNPQKAVGTGTAKPGAGRRQTAGEDGKRRPSRPPEQRNRRTRVPTGRRAPRRTASRQHGANGRPTGGHPRTARAPPRASAGNGKKTSNDAEIEPVVVPKEHPRSRSKRTRKAR